MLMLFLSSIAKSACVRKDLTLENFFDGQTPTKLSPPSLAQKPPSPIRSFSLSKWAFITLSPTSLPNSSFTKEKFLRLYLKATIPFIFLFAIASKISLFRHLKFGYPYSS